MNQNEISDKKITLKDRSRSLVIVGILHTAGGGFCILATLLMIVITTALTPGVLSVSEILSVLTINLIPAVFGITIGIGTIRAKRWARSIAAISHLITAVLSGLLIILFYFVIDKMRYNGAPALELPNSFYHILYAVTALFLGIFGIVFPLIFFRFFRSASVKTTCELKNPSPSWTDKTSLPLLGMSILFSFAILTPFIGFSNNWITPFFGTYQSGISGAFILIIIAVCAGYISWASFRAKISGWWVAVALRTTQAVNVVFTNLHVDRRVAYEKMNYSAEKIETLTASNYFDANTLILIAIMGWFVYMTFLLLVRKEFKTISGSRG